MDGVMPMRIEGIESIRDIFSIFHDGSLLSCVDEGGELSLEVEIEYLAKRIDPNFKRFSVRLFEVSDINFSTWPSDLAAKPATLTKLVEIFAADLEVLEGNFKGDLIEVVCNQHSSEFGYCGGELRFRCRRATVTDEAGKEYSIEELGALSKGYWDEWSKRNQA